MRTFPEEVCLVAHDRLLLDDEVLGVSLQHGGIPWEHPVPFDLDLCPPEVIHDGYDQGLRQNLVPTHG